MERHNDEKQIVSYLLGELIDDEQVLVEERVLTDDAYFDLLRAAEDDLIDEYLSGTLSADARQRFETHFLCTPERREKLRFAAALREYVSADSAPHEPEAVSRTAWWSRLISVPSLRFAAAVIIVVALGLGTWRVFFYESELNNGLAALNKAYGAERPVEARISEFDYAPFPVTRGDEPRTVDKLSLKRAEVKIVDEAQEHAGVESLHALGKLYLTEKKFDEAIEQFEKALALDDRNAQLHSDLGAALLEKGKLDRSKGDGGKSLEEFARSLEHLSRALELDGNLLEALFNRALSREYAGMRPLAEEDWRLYLQKDQNSKWADEARHKLRELEEQKGKVSQTKDQLYQEFLNAYQAKDSGLAWEAFTRSRMRAGNTIVEKLTDDYLKLLSEARSREANDILKVLLYAGELELEKAGDRFTFDLAHFYKTVSPKQRPLLIRGRELTRAGQTQIAESGFKSAFETYNQAKRAFDQAGDKCESRFADYWLAICYSQGIDPQQSASRFQEIAADSERDNHKWLVVRALNGLALHNVVLNEYSRAIGYSNHSRELAGQIQDTYGLVPALLELIRSYSYLGNRQQSLTYLQQLLSLACDRQMEPIQLCVCYARTAWTLHLEAFERASLDYQRLALGLALELKEPTMICASYVNLGMIQARLSNFEEALANVRQAFEKAKTRSDETAGSLMMAYSSLNLGSLQRQAGDWQSAVESYNESVELYDKLNYPLFVHEAHKGLLQCFIASGDIASAEEELTKAIGYYEDHRSKIREQGNRNTYFDLEQDIYDLAIDFEYSKINSPRKAFEYSEQSRGRSLLDMIRTGSRATGQAKEPEIGAPTEPLDLNQIQEALSEHAQVLQYAVLENKLLIWFFTKAPDSFKSFEQPIASKELSERVRKYSLLVSNPGSDLEEISSLAKDLYGILIGQAEPFLDKDKQLFIIADKFLNNVPFQSLISPTTGIYLLADYRLALSPSSSVLIACSQEASAKAEIKQEAGLSVGVNRFYNGEDGNLPDLPSADREAREVAACYRPSPSLTGEHATKKEVLREIGKANVIHIASHFIPGDVSPLRSKLLLAGEPEASQSNRISNGVLEASEIYETKLPAAKLVVLSACHTGIERYYRGEGAISLAHAFIAAKVPLVLASLWDIDSASATELMINFHRHRRYAEEPSAAALRSSQLAMLRSTDGPYRHPYYWASFNLIGGYADY